MDRGIKHIIQAGVLMISIIITMVFFIRELKHQRNKGVLDKIETDLISKYELIKDSLELSIKEKQRLDYNESSSIEIKLDSQEIAIRNMVDSNVILDSKRNKLLQKRYFNDTILDRTFEEKSNNLIKRIDSLEFQVREVEKAHSQITIYKVDQFINSNNYSIHEYLNYYDALSNEISEAQGDESLPYLKAMERLNEFHLSQYVGTEGFTIKIEAYLVLKKFTKREYFTKTQSTLFKYEVEKLNTFIRHLENCNEN